MKYKKIVLAGGSGYLGNVLADYYSACADKVIILSRSGKPQRKNIETVIWDGETLDKWVTALEDANLLINLSGKNVNCRYTAENRKEIIRSRVLPTAVLGKAINALANPPELWINITSATIYRHAEDRPQDEATGEIGHGFSIEVCKAWEKAFFAAATPGIRKVALRMAIVFGTGDGAFPRLVNLFKFGLGGKQGNGKQLVSWVHEQDAARCTAWLLNHGEITGVVNCSAPQVVTNKTLMQMIRKAYGVSFGLPSPAWLLAIGARLIGTETELILKSRWVTPDVLLKNGFTFKYSEPEKAIQDILRKTK